MHDNSVFATWKSPGKRAHGLFGRVNALEIAIAVVLTVAALFAGVIWALADTRELPEERQRQLTEFVRQDCGSCHGMTLKGGLGRPLSAESFRGRESEAIAAIILDGIPGTAMPPWRGLLSDAEANWIAAALKRGAIR